MSTLGISTNFLAQYTNLDDQIQALLLLGANEYKQEISFLMNMQNFGSSSLAKHEWYEEEALSYKGVLQDNYNTTDTVLEVSNINAFAVTQVILIGSEQMLVTAVDLANDEITVVRGHASTVATSHSTGANVAILGNAQAEGGVDSLFQRSPRTLVQNFFQEFTNKVDLTTRAINTSMKDFDDLYMEELQRQVWAQMRMMDRAMLLSNGVFDATAGQHTLKGIIPLIAERNGITQATLGYSNGAFAGTDLANLYFELNNRSSEVVGIMCNVETKNFLTALAKAEGVYTSNVNQGDTNLKAGVYYDGIVTSGWDGRVLPFILNKNVPTGSALFIDTNSYGGVARIDRTYGGSDVFLKLYEEGNNNTARKTETIKSEVTLEVARADKQAFITNMF